MKTTCTSYQCCTGWPEQEPGLPPASHAASGHPWPLWKREAAMPISLGFPWILNMRAWHGCDTHKNLCSGFLGGKVPCTHMQTVCPSSLYCRVRSDAGWRTRAMTMLPRHPQRNMWLLWQDQIPWPGTPSSCTWREGGLSPCGGLGSVWDFTLLIC